MNLVTFEHLLSAEGQSALAIATDLKPGEADFLATFEKLRKRVSPELAKAAAETAILRGKAAAKFPQAERMYFTREALEQASSAVVAGYRAKRFRDYPHVADLCCGVGADALALAAVGCRVTAVDCDPLRVKMAEANVAACGFADRVRVVVADVLADPLPEVDAAFCDPSRRSDGKRYLSVRDYLPTPAVVVSRFPRGFPLAFKLAPGVPLEDLDTFTGEVEFVSLGGELKECVVWLGSSDANGRRATVLPNGASFHTSDLSPSTTIRPPLRYVYDPDPALSRSGLVRVWAAPPMHALNEHFSLLTSDTLVLSEFTTVYAVEAALPFHAKRVGEWLRAHHVGRVTPIKRGSRVDSDALVRGWKLKGDEHRAVLFTEYDAQPVAIIGRRVTATDGGRPSS